MRLKSLAFFCGLGLLLPAAPAGSAGPLCDLQALRFAHVQAHEKLWAVRPPLDNPEWQLATKELNGAFRDFHVCLRRLKEATYAKK